MTRKGKHQEGKHEEKGEKENRYSQYSIHSQSYKKKKKQEGKKLFELEGRCL